jgi:TatD DNase family protein
MLFDTHVHVNAEQFNEDLEDVIERAKEAGVNNMVVVGFDRPTIIRAMELIEAYDFMYAAVGWHPVDAIDMTGEDLLWIEELSNHPKVVAIGEMGLDYRGINHRKVQMECSGSNPFGEKVVCPLSSIIEGLRISCRY